MSYGTQGSSNKQIYDCCFYSQDLQQSTDPLQYQLYFGQAENCSKCIDKKAWYKFDSAVVDAESELHNLNRPLSRCDKYKYDPKCKPSKTCTSTFDPNMPRILSPSLCPIVYNNIAKPTGPGYTVPNTNICDNNTWTKADNVNTYRNYNERNNAILDNNTEDINMFMNSCSQQPLYNGGSERVKPYYINTYNSAPVMNNEMHKIHRRPEKEEKESPKQEGPEQEGRPNYIEPSTTESTHTGKLLGRHGRGQHGSGMLGRPGHGQLVSPPGSNGSGIKPRDQESGMLGRPGHGQLVSPPGSNVSGIKPRDQESRMLGRPGHGQLESFNASCKKSPRFNK